MSINFNKKKVCCKEFDKNIGLLSQKTLELEKQMENSRSEFIEKNKTVKLTERELEVLKCLIQDKNNQEISDELCISLTTVKAHVSNILTKLDASDRIEAGHIAKQPNLL